MKKIEGIIPNGFEPDTKKLEETISELNKLQIGDDWDTVPGLSMFTEVTNFNNKIDIKPYGIVLILFVNKRTGELKSFPHYIFKQDKNAI